MNMIKLLGLVAFIVAVIVVLLFFLHAISWNVAILLLVADGILYIAGQAVLL